MKVKDFIELLAPHSEADIYAEISYGYDGDLEIWDGNHLILSMDIQGELNKLGALHPNNPYLQNKPYEGAYKVPYLKDLES